MIYRYEYPETFDGLERTDFSLYSGNLVLWGAGKIGSITAHVLKQKGIKVLAFVDMLSSKQGTKFCGLDIISPETFFRDYANSELIITTVGRADVVPLLEEHGFTNWHDAWPLLMEFEFADYSEYNQMYMTRMIGYYFRTIARELGLKKRFLVSRLRVMVTSRCSLRCKECSVFVPYVKNPHDDDWEQIVSDIKIFLDAVKELQEIELFGGEPLLYPNLSKIVSALKNEERIKQISVITNGTILPDDQLIQALKNDSRIIYRMSCYGSLSTKIEETESILKMNGIRHEIIDYKTWYKNSEIKLLNETDEQLRKKFSCCMEGCGMAYWCGKIYFCATLPFLIEINAFPQSDDNFYDIRNSVSDYQKKVEEIYQYAARSNTDCYVDACRYCTGKSTANFKQSVAVAEQVKGLMEMPVIDTKQGE